MNAEIKAGIHNRFDIEVIDARTGKVRQRAQALNVVCDTYWTAFSFSEFIKGIAYGSGTGTPSASDTALFHYEGYKAHQLHDGITWNVQIDSEGTVSASMYARLDVSEAVGITLSEVGCSTGNAGIVTHAMLQDMNGNTITIEKTDTDIINIYATVFCHIDASIKSMIPLPLNGNAGFYFPTAFCGCGVYQGIQLTNVIAYRELPTQIVLTHYYSFSCTIDRQNKRIIASGRLGTEDCNLDGGIKYVVFAIGGLYADSQINASPYVIIPIGNSQDIYGYTISGDSIGTGDGSETAFQTHFDVARDFVLKVNGTAVSNYTRDGRNITFSAAPEVGAVVTADYFTDTIPKDENHVYDLTVTISFGEYTPE